MDLQEAVDSIWESAQQGIYYPAEGKGKFNVEEAYQVQLGILQRYLAKGETQAGWKVGLTAKAIQDQLDVHEPVFGFLLESGRKPSGFLLDFEELVAPCMEVELCLTLGKPLKGPGISPADAREALSAVEPWWPPFGVDSPKGPSPASMVSVCLPFNIGFTGLRGSGWTVRTGVIGHLLRTRFAGLIQPWRIS